ncbi:MAG: hypothetical protein ACOYD0_06970 [Candidatus Nanopelagicales bacterium]
MSAAATIALALGVSTWESALVSRLTTGHRDRRIRRCVDVVELLADVGTGLADVVIIDADFPRLDATTVGRISTGARLVIGVSIDEAGEARLRQLGIQSTVGIDPRSPSVAVEQVCALISSTASSEFAANPAGILPSPGVSPELANEPILTGRVLAVWGPAGAPGRTTVALALAEVCGALGKDSLVIDADTTAAGVAPALAMTAPASGLVAACRHSEQGALDVPALARLSHSVDGRYRILTGLPAANRRSEVRPAALCGLLNVARALCDWVIIDLDSAVPRPAANSFAGIEVGDVPVIDSVIDASDVIVAVAGCDPVSLARLMSSIGAVREANQEATVIVVLNRMRGSLLTNAQIAEVRDFLTTQHHVDQVCTVPDDRSGFDAAALAGHTIAEHDPKSAAALALVEAARRTLSLPAIKQQADSVA